MVKIMDLSKISGFPYMVNVYIYIELISIVNAIFVDIMGYMGFPSHVGTPQ